MKIRKATMKDVKELLNLVNNTENLSGDKNDSYEVYTLKQYIEGPISNLFVADINGEIVGFILIEVWKKAKYTYVTDIAVDKRFRGKHIGYNLMIYAEKFAKNQGSKYFFYYMQENNKAMERMSAKLGYKKGRKFIFYSKEIK